jgi:hypothetical protein
VCGARGALILSGTGCGEGDVAAGIAVEPAEDAVVVRSAARINQQDCRMSDTVTPARGG